MFDGETQDRVPGDPKPGEGSPTTPTGDDDSRAHGGDQNSGDDSSAAGSEGKPFKSRGERKEHFQQLEVQKERIDELTDLLEGTVGSIAELTTAVKELGNKGAEPQPAEPTKEELQKKHLMDPLGAVQDVVRKTYREEAQQAQQQDMLVRGAKALTQRIYNRYPELRNKRHPFSKEVDARYMELGEEQGWTPDPDSDPVAFRQLLSTAAAEVAGERPDLRQKRAGTPAGDGNGHPPGANIPPGTGRPDLADDGLIPWTDDLAATLKEAGLEATPERIQRIREEKTLDLRRGIISG